MKQPISQNVKKKKIKDKLCEHYGTLGDPFSILHPMNTSFIPLGGVTKSHLSTMQMVTS